MKYFLLLLGVIVLSVLCGCFSFPAEDLYSIETAYQSPDQKLTVNEAITVNLRFRDVPPDNGELYKYEETYATFTYSGLMKALTDAVGELFPKGAVVVDSEEASDLSVDFDWLQPQLRMIEGTFMTVDMIWQGRIGTDRYTLAIEPSVLTTGEKINAQYDMSSGLSEFPGLGEALGSAIARVAEEIAHTFLNDAPDELLVYEKGTIRWLEPGIIDFEFTDTDFTLPENVKQAAYRMGLIENLKLGQAMISDFDNDGSPNLITLESRESGVKTVFRKLIKGTMKEIGVSRPSLQGKMLVCDRNGDGENELYYFDPLSGVLSEENYIARDDGLYDVKIKSLDFSAGSSSWGMGMTIKRMFSSNITGNEGDILIHYIDAAGETSKGILFINGESVQSLTLSRSSNSVFADINGDGWDDFVDIYSSTNSTWEGNIGLGFSNGKELGFDKQTTRFLSGGLMVIKQGADEQGGYMSLVGLTIFSPRIIGLDLNEDNSEEILLIDDLSKELIILSWQENEIFELARYSLPFTPVNMSYLGSKEGYFIDVLGVLENSYYVLRIECSQDRFVERFEFSKITVEEAFSSVDDMVSTSKGVHFAASKERDTGLSDLLHVFPE